MTILLFASHLHKLQSPRVSLHVVDEGIPLVNVTPTNYRNWNCFAGICAETIGAVIKLPAAQTGLNKFVGLGGATI